MVARRLATLFAFVLVGCASVTPETSDEPTSPASSAVASTRPLIEPGSNWTPTRESIVGPGETLLELPNETEDFWKPPTSLPGSPGNVIWASTSRLIFGGRAQRILYHSSDTMGRPVGVTAWLGLPSTVDENTPIVSWGHGTSGMADDCAPSRQESPATFPFFQQLLDAGYIVVASDFAYLGTPGPHPYYDAATMAYSMIDAAIAAQQFSGSNGPIVYSGYSIGGRGAIFSQAMSEWYAPHLDVRGAATFRPGVDGIAEGGTLWKTLRDSPFKGYIVMAFYGVSLAWGDKYYELGDILTPTAIERLPLLDSTCLGSVLDAFENLSGDDVFEIALDDPLPKGVIGPAEQVTNLPLLVIAGRADTTPVPEVIDSYFAEACANGQPIELRWLNTGHNLPTELDKEIFLDWMDRVLSNQPLINSCRTGSIFPELCRDSDDCFRIATATNLEGMVENPFANVEGLSWNLEKSWNYGYVCPNIEVPCRHNKTEGHISQVWHSTIPVPEADIEEWLEDVYWTSVDPSWQLRLYDEEPRPGWPCGLYFQFLRYNNWGFSTIMPGEDRSEMYVFVTHQNQVSQPPMTDIEWAKIWPCP